jgi:alpha-glucuronidase
MKSGKTLWDEMCYRYNDGVLSVREMQKTWDSQKENVDQPRFEYVQSLLKIQEKEAVWWRNSCLLYFQTFSKMPIPASIEKADKTLEEYMNIKEFFMPGI